MTFLVGANECERLRALRDLRILGTGPDPLLDHAVALTRTLLGTPTVLVSLVEEDHQWFKARCGLDVDSTWRDVAFCNYTILDDELLVVPDARLDPRFADNPLVTGAPHIRFYVGAPLSLDPGLRIGTLCAIDDKPRDLDSRERAAFLDLAALVVGQFRRHRDALAAQEQGRLLKRKEAVLAQAERLANVGGWEFDFATRELIWSDQMYRLYDLPVGRPPAVRVAHAAFLPEDMDRILALRNQAMAGGGGFELEVPFTSALGRQRRVQIAADCEFVDGRPARFYGILKDITEHHAAEQRLWSIANKDALTGLPNRSLFQTRLEEGLRTASASGTRLGLIIVDIDKFKEVNDSLGHDAGDALLRLVAERLRACVPQDSTVARLGGDEFGIIVPDLDDLDHAQMLAEFIIARLRAPAMHGDARLTCRASVGVAVHPDHDASPAELLKSADLALYAAKSAGRDGFVVYEPAMRARMQRRVAVLNQARDALAEDRILPYYQPKVALDTGRVMGFEALLRWRHPTDGLKRPATIAEAFEDPELAVEVGRRMLDRVVADMRGWLDRGVPFGTVALNVSAAEFSRSNFAERVLNRLAAAGIGADRLEVEVTETVFLGQGAEAVGLALQNLDAHRVAVSLDDFGTGYASLTHLKQFPVRWLKIDRSFIKDIEHDGNAAAIVHAVISLGQSLGIGLVAEGIETQGQLEFLRRRRCDLGQGYLIGKPMVGSRVPHFVEAAMPRDPRLGIAV
ncbi:MAG TPA: EAL domain-containing protein [Beijerinckiaceae bacterium]|jgi:diguanylate cyclase (GGDEF)-like protein